MNLDNLVHNIDKFPKLKRNNVTELLNKHQRDRFETSGEKGHAGSNISKKYL